MRAISFDPAIEVGVYPGLLFEMRLVVCGSLPEAGVRWSAVAARAVVDVPSRSPPGQLWTTGRHCESWGGLGVSESMRFRGGGAMTSLWSH